MLFQNLQCVFRKRDGTLGFFGLGLSQKRAPAGNILYSSLDVDGACFKIHVLKVKAQKLTLSHSGCHGKHIYRVEAVSFHEV